MKRAIIYWILSSLGVLLLLFLGIGSASKEGKVATPFVILFLAALVALLFFWIKMIVHASKNLIKNKTLWILVLIFGGIGMAFIYYFFVKRKFDKVNLG